MPDKENGHLIKLTWAQIAWAIVTLVTLLGQWYDTRAQLLGIRTELSVRVQAADKEHLQMWQAIRDVQAGEKK